MAAIFQYGHHSRRKNCIFCQIFFTHLAELKDVCVEIYVYGYGEAKYTTIELLRGLFQSFLSINVKKYHKNRIVA